MKPEVNERELYFLGRCEKMEISKIRKEWRWYETLSAKGFIFLLWIVFVGWALFSRRPN